jgi:DNA-binding response OmpR family regulator
MRILYIEDDRELAEVIKKDLKEYFSVDTAYTGTKGWFLIQHHQYDLLIIDYILPDLDGLEVCQMTRKAGLAVPILMLTGESEVETKVNALNSGADDYLTKPFVFSELLARIRALLRRPPAFISDTLQVADLTLDLTNQVAMRQDSIIPLRRKEFRLLEYLMRNVGQTLTKRMILEHVWEGTFDSSANVVEVNINSLRDLIDKPFKKHLIHTVYGLGYKIDTKKKKGGDKNERIDKKGLNKQGSKK